MLNLIYEWRLLLFSIDLLGLAIGHWRSYCIFFRLLETKFSAQIQIRLSRDVGSLTHFPVHRKMRFAISTRCTDEHYLWHHVKTMRENIWPDCHSRCLGSHLTVIISKWQSLCTLLSWCVCARARQHHSSHLFRSLFCCCLNWTNCTEQKHTLLCEPVNDSGAYAMRHNNRDRSTMKICIRIDAVALVPRVREPFFVFLFSRAHKNKW